MSINFQASMLIYAMHAWSWGLGKFSDNSIIFQERGAKHGLLKTGLVHDVTFSKDHKGYLSQSQRAGPMQLSR